MPFTSRAEPARLSPGAELDPALSAAIEGMDWGWAAIYRELAPAVTGYLRAQGACEPEDLTGEVFVQAVRAINRFRGDAAAFRSWIFCIAHNKMVDDARYRRRRPAELASDPGRDNIHPDNVEEQVMGKLADARVRELIAGLTAQQADVLLLRIIGGLTLDEVARVTGSNPSSVKALQRRGLANLRRAMSAQAYPFEQSRRLPVMG